MKGRGPRSETFDVTDKGNPAKDTEKVRQNNQRKTRRVGRHESQDKRVLHKGVSKHLD